MADERESGVAETVDAHHHLWRYTPEEFGWLEGGMEALQRDFLPDDLVVAMKGAGVDGAVAVQARQSLEETRWLLQLAEECPQIWGVVGWAPITSSDFLKTMEEFSGQRKLRGLRHIIQAEADENFILREDFNAGIRSLRGSGLVYDILIFERHLPQSIRFVDMNPEQQFVLDHIAKPKIAEGELEPWATNICELAKREHVVCKISGIVTEAKWNSWSMDTLRPYLDVVVEAFGPERLMVGSDWPVCLVASEYSRWFSLLQEYFAGFSAVEQERIFGGTAIDVYGLR